MSTPTSTQSSEFMRSASPSWDPSNPPSPTISNLLEELISLLGETVIENHREARELLETCSRQFYARNGFSPLQSQEITIYNLSQNLIDAQGKINMWCLEELKKAQISYVSYVSLYPSENTTQFDSTKRYKISIAQKCYSQEAGWFLAAHGNLSKDRRDINSTYSMVTKLPAVGTSWHIFTEDRGKTYKIALATDAYDQQGWFLGFRRHYKVDSRVGGNSFFTFVHKPEIDNCAWHIEPKNSGTYKLILASDDSAIKNWQLICSRTVERDKRNQTSTYTIIARPGHGECEWKIESEA